MEKTYLFFAVAILASAAFLFIAIRGAVLNSKYETDFRKSSEEIMNPDLKPWYRPPGHKPGRAVLGFIVSGFAAFTIAAANGWL